MIVRRKVGEPTDFMHTKSRKLKKQRDNLALASQHYANLTPSQKAITRHQFEEVEYQKSHGKTDTKLLSGRQLFISKEIHSLETTGRQIVLPYELCIMLTDYALNPLDGELWLRYLKLGEWIDCRKEQLATGCWLFSEVPRAQEAYRPYGEAEGYLDPQEEQYQAMSADEIRAYHYHRLLPYRVIFEFTDTITLWHYLWELTRLAQTFGLTEAKTLTGVVLWCYRFLTGNDGTLYIRLYKTTDGIPSGACLSTGERRLTSMNEVGSPFTIPITPYTLEPSTTYAIVALVVMDKTTPYADQPYIGILDPWNFQPPYAYLYSNQPAGNDWTINTHRRCLWMKLLG
ncbi:hypothetical protein ES703_31516 [subsurface metagenome]